MVYLAAQPDSVTQSLHIIDDPYAGVLGVIAIDSTTLGPAAGGCRLWSYGDLAELTEDASRLARGMSYKNAMAGLPFGGGKAVLQRPAGEFDRAALFRVFADAVARLDGRYITAEDVGTTIADMQAVRGRTRFVAGLDAVPGKAGGDPSPWTALGVFQAMQAAAMHTFGTDVRGLTVAVQGVGNVGLHLCELLAGAGAKLVVADVNDSRAAALAGRLGARHVGTAEILSVDADILAPCALGGVLNAGTIPALSARLVCGGANNQLATEADGEALRARGIVYAPDYVINAGGIINVAAEYLGETTGQVQQRVDQIAPRLKTILDQAARDSVPPGVVADAMAEALIARPALVTA